MDINHVRDVLAGPSPPREVIPTTMGEPLMWPRMLEMIGLVRNSRAASLNVTTNGSKLNTRPGLTTRNKKLMKQLPSDVHLSDDDMKKTYAELLVPNTTDVKLSWNGASQEVQERIMVGSSLKMQLIQLDHLLKTRDQHYQDSGHYCSVTLQMTFMKQNLEDIPNVRSFELAIGSSLCRL